MAFLYVSYAALSDSLVFNDVSDMPRGVPQHATNLEYGDYETNCMRFNSKFCDHSWSNMKDTNGNFYASKDACVSELTNLEKQNNC